MEALKLMLIILFCISFVYIRAKPMLINYDQEDYYWQNYTGEIPIDAFPGGIDVDGKTTYIGQVPAEKGTSLIPGQIDPSNKVLNYVKFGKVATTNENVKIFCVRHPEQYEWIQTNAHDVRFLTHKHLIAGGYNGNDPYTLGRKIWGSEVVVGRVFMEKTLEGLFLIANGTVERVQKSYFEVLSFNPNIPIGSKSSICSGKVYNVYFN